MEEGKEKGRAAVGDDTGNRMSHISQFTSPVRNVSDSRQICSHSEGARREGKVIKVSNFKGLVHRLKNMTQKSKKYITSCAILLAESTSVIYMVSEMSFVFIP